MPEKTNRINGIKGKINELEFCFYSIPIVTTKLYNLIIFLVANNFVWGCWIRVINLPKKFTIVVSFWLVKIVLFDKKNGLN